MTRIKYIKNADNKNKYVLIKLRLSHLIKTGTVLKGKHRITDSMETGIAAKSKHRITDSVETGIAVKK